MNTHTETHKSRVEDESIALFPTSYTQPKASLLVHAIVDAYKLTPKGTLDGALDDGNIAREVGVVRDSDNPARMGRRKGKKRNECVGELTALLVF
jgi:hypothetical protein